MKVILSQGFKFAGGDLFFFGWRFLGFFDKPME